MIAHAERRSAIVVRRATCHAIGAKPAAAQRLRKVLRNQFHAAAHCRRDSSAALRFSADFSSW